MTSEERNVAEPTARKTGSKEPSQWLVVGVYGALGAEFVSGTLGAVVVGSWIDRKLHTDPYGVLLSVVLALTSIGWHVARVTRRLLRDGEN